MRRLLFAVALLLLAANTALAFDVKRAPTRVGVLRVSAELTHESELMVADSVVRYLHDALRSRGIDAFDTGLTYEDISRDGVEIDADYFVEIFGAGANTDSVGGIGIGGRNGGVSIEVVVARVAAELRVYDAVTLEPLVSAPLAKRNTAVMPTSIGIGGRSIYAVIAIPFVRRAQYRSAAQAVSRQAAATVATALEER